MPSSGLPVIPIHKWREEELECVAYLVPGPHCLPTYRIKVGLLYPQPEFGQYYSKPEEM